MMNRVLREQRTLMSDQQITSFYHSSICYQEEGREYATWSWP